MKFAEFAWKIEEEYASRFPGGYCRVEKYVCLGRRITIDMYVGGKVPGRNAPMMGDNDMFKIRLNVFMPDKFDYAEDELPEKMTMESRNNHYLINPEYQYMAFSSRKVPYRKTTGTAEKLIAVVEKFMDRLHDMVADDLAAGNIHKDYIQAVKKNIA